MTGDAIARLVGRLVRCRRRPAHKRGCSPDFRSGTLVPGGMDWRSLGGLPGGLGVCGDGIVMLFLSGPGEGWGTGGCTAVHTQEVARRQRFTNRHFRLLILCSIIPGAPDGSSPFWCAILAQMLLLVQILWA